MEQDKVANKPRGEAFAPFGTYPASHAVNASDGANCPSRCPVSDEDQSSLDAMVENMFGSGATRQQPEAGLEGEVTSRDVDDASDWWNGDRDPRRLTQVIANSRRPAATRLAVPTVVARDACPASPDHADIMETIENASDDWQKHGYTSALAEVRDMANVGRALMETLPKGYSYLNCPSEIVSDLQNERDEALAQVAVNTLPPTPLGDSAKGADERQGVPRATPSSDSALHEALERFADYARNLDPRDLDSDRMCLATCGEYRSLLAALGSTEA